MQLIVKTLVFFLIFQLTACSKSTPERAKAPPVAVIVTPVTETTTAASYDFIGQAEAIAQVELRARVAGTLMQQPFEEGANVVKDDVLFIIEPAEYQVAFEAAEAQLAKMRAVLTNATLDADRMAELLKKQSVSQAQYDDAEAAKEAAQADVQAAKAALASAQLNLDYTKIHAPINGVIDRAKYDVGNLIGPDSGVLATINKMDPIYVTFTISETAYLAKKQAEGGADETTAKTFTPYLKLANGTQYAHAGTIDYIDNKIDHGTGTLLIRAIFPNPDRWLIPGQYVSVVVQREDEQSVFVIPQTAVMTDQRGHHVWVVNKASQVAQKRVELGATLGTQVIIKQGLSLGERVITQGGQKVRSGMTVTVKNAAEGKSQ